MGFAKFAHLSGEAGVRQTLNKMTDLINGAILDPLIRDQAAAVTIGCGKGNRRCVCAGLLAWVHRRVSFVPDTTDHEVLHDPRLIARAIVKGKQVYGDCDDLSMYLAALLKSVGLRPILRAVGYDGHYLQHVYVSCEGMKLDPARDPWQVTMRPYLETSVLEKVV